MQHYVITIGRQFGSGGRELGRILADRLGIPFYDKDMLYRAAREAGMSPEIFVNNDEKMPSFLGNLIPFGFGVSPMSWYSGTTAVSDESIYKMQSDFIYRIASQGPCIIVGRTADYVLRDLPNVLNVFVHADCADCAKRIMSRVDCKDAAKATKMAERVNKLRANYYNFYTDKRWGDAASYDMTFNSSLIPIADIADIIASYVGRHFKN